MLDPTVNPVGYAATAENLIGSLVEARVLADGAPGRPSQGAADAVRGSGHGAVGHDSLSDEIIIAFQGLLIVVLGPAAHVNHAYSGVGQLLGHLHEVDQPGRVLAEACLVPGHPAHE